MAMDFVVARLCGRFVTDHTMAGGSSVLRPSSAELVQADPGTVRPGRGQAPRDRMEWSGGRDAKEGSRRRAGPGRPGAGLRGRAGSEGGRPGRGNRPGAHDDFPRNGVCPDPEMHPARHRRADAHPLLHGPAERKVGAGRLGHRHQRLGLAAQHLLRAFQLRGAERHGSGGVREAERTSSSIPSSPAPTPCTRSRESKGSCTA